MERKIFIQLSNVTTPVITIAKNKYNLPRAMMYHTDDGIIQARLHAEQIWDAIGCSYSDGCGNDIEYTTDVAVNTNAGNLSEYQTLIERKGAIINHSAFHSGENPLNQLEIIYDYYIDAINYKVAGVAIPGSDTGYGDASIAHREPFVISTGDVFDSLNPVRWYLKAPEPIGTAPFAINRQFTDWDSDEILDILLGYLNQSAETVDVFPIGSHSALENQEHIDRFITFFTELNTNKRDEFIVCSLREYIEYRLMREVDMDVQVVGNLMTVTLQDSDVQLIDKISWMDNCFNVTGATVTGVTHEGFDEVNFNGSTGLINAHKRITSWGAAPIRVNMTYTIQS